MPDKNWIGMTVHLLRDRIIPFENPFNGTISYEGGPSYTTDDEFFVEHDFRSPDNPDGIRVVCPEKDGFPELWMSMTTEQFVDWFGSDALRELDSMRGA